MQWQHLVEQYCKRVTKTKCHVFSAMLLIYTEQKFASYMPTALMRPEKQNITSKGPYFGAVRPLPSPPHPHPPLSGACNIILLKSNKLIYQIVFILFAVIDSVAVVFLSDSRISVLCYLICHCMLYLRPIMSIIVFQ